MDYAIRRQTGLSYDEALAKLPEALKSEGFGVLTEIDVKNTLQQKLGVDFRRYRIIGACNPPFAHKALLAETEIGLMMPCNLVVYEGEGGKATVAAINPRNTIGLVGNPALEPLAAEISDRLARVLERL